MIWGVSCNCGILIATGNSFINNMLSTWSHSPPPISPSRKQQAWQRFGDCASPQDPSPTKRRCSNTGPPASLIAVQSSLSLFAAQPPSMFTQPAAHMDMMQQEGGMSMDCSPEHQLPSLPITTTITSQTREREWWYVWQHILPKAQHGTTATSWRALMIDATSLWRVACCRPPSYPC